MSTKINNRHNKKQVYKPGSVSANWRMLIIYLAPSLLKESSCLPTEIGLAILNLPLIWHCNAMGLLTQLVTKLCRELLPHVFTFVHRLVDSYFL